MLRRIYLLLYFLLTVFSSLPLVDAYAAPRKVSKITISGTVTGGSGYKMLLLSNDGSIQSTTLSSKGSFTFKNIKSSLVKDGTLQLMSSKGGYFGPVVLSHTGKAKKGYVRFSGKLPSNATSLKLGKITLKSGYGILKSSLTAAAINTKRTVVTDNKGAPVGSGKMGLATVSTARLQAHLSAASETGGGGDADGDGIPNALDVDDNGNLNLDGTDPSSAASTAHDNPFTTLYLGISDTLNVNLGNVTQSAIDANVSSNGKFALIMYLSLPPDTASSITGGHVICDTSLEYCRSTADGGGTAVYSGVSESNPAILNQLWSNYNADGSGYPNFEIITQGSNKSLVAAIQPRVGTDKFKAGDIYQVVLMNGSAVQSTKTLVLSPYFVTVPALKNYDAGSGIHTVDYTNGSEPGVSSGAPVVLTASGTLAVNLWRPQRQTVDGAETGSYRDMGHLHYGVIVSDNSGEFGCAGNYSALSTTLTESTGTGGSPNLWPLTDSSDDLTPDAANILSFTVDLKSCIAANGRSSGTFNVTLTAAGESLSGGSNRAAQLLYVTIP